LEFATAILNSKLTNFIYKNYTGEDGRTFAEVKPKNIRKLYIPKIDKSKQSEFIKLVHQIMDRKTQNEDTKELEDKIDDMVYKLYDLTKDEIKTIESN
jgi:hypothetical protein